MSIGSPNLQGYPEASVLALSLGHWVFRIGFEAFPGDTLQIEAGRINYIPWDGPDGIRGTISMISEVGNPLRRLTSRLYFSY